MDQMATISAAISVVAYSWILNQWPQSNCIFRPAGCPGVCLQCRYCIHHKGILSHPSWSYQSPAELRGVGKVIHTTGGSIHTADSPQCCLLCLFNSVWAWRDSVEPLSLVFGFCMCVFASEETEPRSEVIVTASRQQWHFLSLHLQKQRKSERNDCTECPQLPHYLLGCLCPHVERAPSASLL